MQVYQTVTVPWYQYSSIQHNLHLTKTLHPIHVQLKLILVYVVTVVLISYSCQNAKQYIHQTMEHTLLPMLVIQTVTQMQKVHHVQRSFVGLPRLLPNYLYLFVQMSYTLDKKMHNNVQS